MERESALPHKSRNINQESGLSVTLTMYAQPTRKTGKNSTAVSTGRERYRIYYPRLCHPRCKSIGSIVSEAKVIAN